MNTNLEKISVMSMLLTILLQTVAGNATVDVELGTITEPSLNLWELTLKGGFIMIPLLLLSILTIYIFVERMLVLRAAAKEDDTFMQRIKDYIHNGDIESALALCKNNNTPVARLIEKGITRLGRPMNDVLVAIENEGNIEVAKLERRFSWVATTAAGAPMLGFLGTVLGMVSAFHSMAAAGEAADISTLSSGIYEALVTTVAGLVVGIIAMFAYNLLVSRVSSVVNTLEARTMDFMDLLNEPVVKK